MIVCFLLFIFGFAVASFISEDREFSENENRYLQQAPEFSWKKLEKGEFTSDIESYMSDQIFMKDQLVSLKTVTDRTLLKNYQNGVYFNRFGKNHRCTKNYRKPTRRTNCRYSTRLLLLG